MRKKEVKEGEIVCLLTMSGSGFKCRNEKVPVCSPGQVRCGDDSALDGLSRWKEAGGMPERLKDTIDA